jgi:mitotic spindle assembly checkpoint protein MAD2
LAKAQRASHPKLFQTKKTPLPSKLWQYLYHEETFTDLRAQDPLPEKTEKEIQDEIQSLFRQITASVTFLPMLDGNCTFNVLVYADADSEVPMEWGDSDAKEIENSEKVQLRSFSTSNHRVDTIVSYR